MVEQLFELNENFPLFVQVLSGGQMDPVKNIFRYDSFQYTVLDKYYKLIFTYRNSDNKSISNFLFRQFKWLVFGVSFSAKIIVD